MILESRHNKTSEEKELAAFAAECARLGVFHCVKNVLFDSIANWAVIETGGIPTYTTAGMRIRHAAERCFTQFESDGIVYHKIDCDCEQCAEAIQEARSGGAQ